jgi:adenylate cyclase
MSLVAVKRKGGAVEAETFRRRLAAIMSADVKEYSRLMREDESSTVQTLKSYREVMSVLIGQHHGRVVDSPGDNVLAEFASVVDAVQSAVAIQKELALCNAKLVENRRMVFRIGINLGDVIADGDRIYGDGVNIAARLQDLAEPGGICISRTAYDQIEDKLPLGYEYLGERSVKNIARPVPAYKVILDPEGSATYARRREDDRQYEGRGRSEGPPIEEGEAEWHRGRARFLKHFRTYAAVIAFLFIINLLKEHGSWWFYWPALGWGLVLFLHWSRIRYRLQGRPPSSFKAPLFRGAGEPGYLRVIVEPKNGESEKHGRVNIRVPLKLLRAGVKLGSALPDHAKEKINAVLREKGLNFDISSLERGRLEDLLSSLDQMNIDVDDEDKTVHIFFE